MPLIGGSIPLGATFAPTGGSATDLLDLGGDRTGRKLLIDDAAEFSLASVINCSKQDTQVNSSYPGGYTPLKRRAARLKPITLADGSVFTNQIISELIVHPETTAAQITELLSTQVNILNDADFDDFWKDGVMS